MMNTTTKKFGKNNFENCESSNEKLEDGKFTESSEEKSQEIVGLFHPLKKENLSPKLDFRMKSEKPFEESSEPGTPKEEEKMLL